MNWSFIYIGHWFEMEKKIKVPKRAWFAINRIGLSVGIFSKPKNLSKVKQNIKDHERIRSSGERKKNYWGSMSRS